MSLTTKQNHRRAAVLRDLERSGLSMSQFCRQAGLAYSTVAAWRGAQRRETTSFIEVESTVTPPEQPERGPQVLCAELALPGGALLRIYTRGAEGGVQ